MDGLDTTTQLRAILDSFFQADRQRKDAITDAIGLYDTSKKQSEDNRRKQTEAGISKIKKADNAKDRVKKELKKVDLELPSIEFLDKLSPEFDTNPLEGLSVAAQQATDLGFKIQYKARDLYLFREKRAKRRRTLIRYSVVGLALITLSAVGLFLSRGWCSTRTFPQGTESLLIPLCPYFSQLGLLEPSPVPTTLPELVSEQAEVLPPETETERLEETERPEATLSNPTIPVATEKDDFFVEGCAQGDMNVRENPGQANRIVGSLMLDTCINFDARTANSNWLRIAPDQDIQVGWVISTYVALEAGLDQLLVIQYTPPE